MTPAHSLSQASIPSAEPDAPALAPGQQLLPLTQEMIAQILPIENVAFSHPLSLIHI